MMPILASFAVLRVVQGTHITDTVGRIKAEKSVGCGLPGR